MKIGAFASHNRISIDTVRHYMDLSLIMPEKVGANYFFDAQCQQDYDDVRQLKSIGFALGEIQKIFQFKRIGQLTDYTKRNNYMSYFEHKKIELEEAIKGLMNQKSALEDFVHKMSDQQKREEIHLGVPFEALPLLNCTICRKSYTLQEGQVAFAQLKSGSLSCSCGQQLVIEDGILIGAGAVIEGNQEPFAEGYIDEYIQTTDSEYLEKLYRGMEWSKRHMSFQRGEKGVILELGSGYGFFLRNFVEDIPESGLYIAVDYNLNTLRWLKTILERSAPSFKVLFLCADFDTIPLKENCVDLILDISGSSNYAFEHTQFLLESIHYLMKPSCELHGYYIAFNKFAFHSKIKEGHKPLFMKGNIISEIAKLGFVEIGSMESEPIERGGPFEDYFVEGEQVSSFVYYGKR